VTDAELLDLSARGDAAAFEDLVARHEHALLRYVRALTSQHDVAEDALQETFLAAWRAAGEFHGGGSARGWLFSIARHEVGRRARAVARGAADEAELATLGVAAGWGHDPSTDAEISEAADGVHRALSSLDPVDREVLVLHDLEQLDLAETAAVLALGVAATKSRVHRARLRLAAHLRRGGRHGVRT